MRTRNRKPGDPTAKDWTNENSDRSHRRRITDCECTGSRIWKRKKTATGCCKEGGSGKKEGRRGGLSKGTQEHTGFQGKAGSLERRALVARFNQIEGMQGL